MSKFIEEFKKNFADFIAFGEDPKREVSGGWTIFFSICTCLLIAVIVVVIKMLT